MKYTIVGATGNVGRCALEGLVKRGVPPEAITLIASSRSKGTPVFLGEHTWVVKDFEEKEWEHDEVCLFTTEDDVSKKYIPQLLQEGKVFLLDSSSAYRTDPQVPLIVPPLNASRITLEQKLYAHGNCIAVPLSMVLSPLLSFSIRAIHVATYQSASGAGHQAMKELCHDTAVFLTEEHVAVASGQFPYSPSFPHTPAFNAIPLVGSLGVSGITSEEQKVCQEVQKILEYPLALFVTSVRVPTLQGHGISVWIQVQKDMSLEEFHSALKKGYGLCFWEKDGVPTPAEILGSDMVWLGRIHKAAPYHFHVWATTDNLRRGAATDIVESAMYLSHLLERAKGFEPSTPTLGRLCSTN